MNTIFLQGIGAISLIPENGSNSLGGIVFMMNTRPDEIVSVGLHLTSVGVSDLGFRVSGFGCRFQDVGSKVWIGVQGPGDAIGMESLRSASRCGLNPGKPVSLSFAVNESFYTNDLM